MGGAATTGKHHSCLPMDFAFAHRHVVIIKTYSISNMEYYFTTLLPTRDHPGVPFMPEYHLGNWRLTTGYPMSSI